MKDTKNWVLWGFYFYAVLSFLLTGLRFVLPGALADISQKETVASYLISEVVKLAVLGVFVLAAKKNSKMSVIGLAIFSILLAVFGSHTSTTPALHTVLILMRVTNLGMAIAAVVFAIRLGKAESLQPAAQASSVGTQIGSGISWAMLCIGAFLMLTAIANTFFCQQFNPNAGNGCADSGIIFIPVFLIGLVLAAIGGAGLSLAGFFRKK